MKNKNEKIRYFSISILFLILSQIVAQLFRFIARIIIARYSSTDVYGLFSVIWNEMSFLGLAVLLGLGQQLTIDLPRFDKNKKKHMIYSSIFYSLIFCVIISMLALVLNLIQIDNTYKYSLIVSIFFVLFLLNQFILIGIKDFFGIFLLNSLQNISLLLLIVLLRNRLTIENIAYAAAGSIAFASISVLLYILVRYRYLLKDIRRDELKIFNFHKGRFYLFVVDIVDSVILYLLVKLPQIIWGSSYAGFVSVAFSIMSFVLILPQIITISTGPLISEEFIKEEYETMHSSFRTSMSLIYLFQCVIIFVFAYFGNPIIEFLYGIEYVSGTFRLFYGFLFAIIIDAFTYPFGMYLRNTKHENLFGIGKIISLLTFVAFESVLLFTTNNMMVIPISYFISKIALLSFYIYSIIKMNDRIETNDVKKLLLWLLYIIISFILILTINYFFDNLVYRLLFLLLHTFVFIIIISLTKIVNLKSAIKNILSIIPSKK
ncbi:MAG: hypothetical protein FK733_11340 [Asgard group archaeon]|nr:hypothetical protein [Asgard group archaeon]